MFSGDVDEAWARGHVPNGDYVLTADGNLTAMRLQLGPPLSWTVSELLDSEPESGWADSVTNVSCVYGGYRALAGETTNYGGTGWVALESADDRQLIWLIVSDGAFVEADSTGGLRWRVSIADPRSVTLDNVPNSEYRPSFPDARP